MTDTNAQPGGETPAPDDAVVVTTHGEPVDFSAPKAAPPDIETDAGTVETEHADDAGADHGEAKKPARGFQKRIDELTARQRDAERDRDHWRDLAMRSGQAAPQPQQPQAPQPLPADLVAHIGAPPDPNKFPWGETDPNYAAALAEHRLLTRMAQAEAQNRAAQAQQADKQFLSTVAEKVSAAAERLPDLSVEALARFGQNVPNHVANAVADLIATSDTGPDVAAWLMGNPNEVRRISALSPAGVLRELGKAEARMEAQLAAPAPVTNAPPPVRTVGGGGATAQRDPNAMSMSEYSEWYHKNIIAKRR
jgi:hypothetical protein